MFSWAPNNNTHSFPFAIIVIIINSVYCNFLLLTQHYLRRNFTVEPEAFITWISLHSRKRMKREREGAYKLVDNEGVRNIYTCISGISGLTAKTKSIYL